MSLLTHQQQRILDWIRAFIASNRIPPTRAEIAKAFGFRSVNAADQHVKAIDAKGELEILDGVSRGIVLPRKPS